ncbi:hypothetical protein [Ruegeria meonggei]|uniref:hypothetical protein n=1 Tax=Ruegeria meonggei TaxID=1446476 RepID=UPI00366BFA29
MGQNLEKMWRKHEEISAQENRKSEEGNSNLFRNSKILLFKNIELKDASRKNFKRAPIAAVTKPVVGRT